MSGIKNFSFVADGVSHPVYAVEFDNGRFVARGSFRLAPVATNTPRAGETAEQSHARTAEARAEYRTQRELIDFAKTGAPPALAAEGNISDVEETPRRVLPRMQTQQPWVGESITQNDCAWVDNSPTYSAVLAARDEKHPTRVKSARPASLNVFAFEAHANNQHWWHDPATGAKLDRNMGELLMLVVSEIAECMEGERKDLMDTHLPHRKMAEVELADATIRLGDIAGSRRLNLDARYTDVHDRQDMPSNKGEALLFVIKPLQSIDRFEGWVFERKIVRTFMRIERYAEKHGYDLWGAVAEKREYNRHRADHKPAARLAANGKKF